jgi:hypothetical protein
MPFITEAVWQRLPRDASSASSLMVSAWPDLRDASIMTRDMEAEGWFASFCTAVSQIRAVRAEKAIPPKERVPLTFWCADVGMQKALESEQAVIAWVARADLEKVSVQSFEARVGASEDVARISISDRLEVDMQLPEQSPVDLEKELARLRKQLNQLTAQLESQEKKITPSFLERAAPAAKEKIIQKAEDLRQQKIEVAGQLEKLELHPSSSRRDVLASLIGGAMLAQHPPPASANVGEGDTLPNGARQEDRIRKGMKAWRELGEKTVKGEVSTDEEWQNSQGFLRRLYGLNDDMGYLAKGLPMRRSLRQRISLPASRSRLSSRTNQRKRRTRHFL